MKSQSTLCTFLLLIICFVSIAQEQLNEGGWKLYPGGEKSDSLSTKNIDSTLVKSDSILAIPPADSSAIDMPKVSTAKIEGNVEIIQDYRIKKLLDKDAYLHSENPTMDGYRVQIFFGSGVDSRDEANKVKSEFLKIYPEEQVTVQYITPNFKTRVGNFRTRMEAERFASELYKDFPESFIVQDKIDLPELKAE